MESIVALIGHSLELFAYLITATCLGLCASWAAERPFKLQTLNLRL